MSLNPGPIMSKLVSIGLESGRFGQVNGFEPNGQPPNGVTMSLISGPLTPIQSGGMTGVCLRWQIDGQVYLPLNYKPTKDIDPKITGAAAGYLEDLCGQFTLGGLVRCVDVFGSDGEALSATPGYLAHGDKTYRVMQLMIPLLINERWTLTP
jgi:hypothetical protein